MPTEFRPPNSDFLRNLSVAEYFPNYPGDSVRWAQALTDEGLRIPQVTAAKQKREIVFWPPFFRISYLVSFRRGRRPPACVIALYGNPTDFHDPKGLLKTGPKSYSGMRVESDEDLEYARPLISAAFRLRYGDYTS